MIDTIAERPVPFRQIPPEAIPGHIYTACPCSGVITGVSHSASGQGRSCKSSRLGPAFLSSKSAWARPRLVIDGNSHPIQSGG